MNVSVLRIHRGVPQVDGIPLWNGALIELQIESLSPGGGRVPGAPAGAFGGPPRASAPTGGGKVPPPLPADIASIAPGPLVISPDIEALLPPPMSRQAPSAPAESARGAFPGIIPGFKGGPPPAFSNAVPAFSAPTSTKAMVVGHVITRGEGAQISYCFAGGGKEYPLVDGTACRLIEDEQRARERYIVPHHSLLNETRVPRLGDRVLGPVHIFTYTTGGDWERCYLHFRGASTLEALFPRQEADGSVSLGGAKVLSSMWRVDLKHAKDIPATTALAEEAARMVAPSVLPPLPAGGLPGGAPGLVAPLPLDEDTIERSFNAVVAFFEARVAEQEGDRGEAQAALDAFRTWEKRREAMDDETDDLPRLPVHEVPEQTQALPVHQNKEEAQLLVDSNPKEAS